MKVIVYVEGPSDKFAMEELLKRLIENKNLQGLTIEFFPAPIGRNKESLINIVPERAANTILNNPNAIVIAIPDLYPKDKCFQHTTASELIEGLNVRFEESLSRKGVGDDERIKQRFKVFCFKYELETLVLAAEQWLKWRLGIDEIAHTWIIPVEDQDHVNHPKLIVERIFSDNGEKYIDKDDAPAILGKADYHDIAKKCPQCFKPFVDFLENLPNIS